MRGTAFLIGVASIKCWRGRFLALFCVSNYSTRHGKISNTLYGSDSFCLKQRPICYLSFFPSWCLFSSDLILECCQNNVFQFILHDYQNCVGICSSSTVTCTPFADRDINASSRKLSGNQMKDYQFEPTLRGNTNRCTVYNRNKISKSPNQYIYIKCAVVV